MKYTFKSIIIKGVRLVNEEPDVYDFHIPSGMSGDDLSKWKVKHKKAIDEFKETCKVKEL